jgi:hypothetical protein
MMKLLIAANLLLTQGLNAETLAMLSGRRAFLLDNKDAVTATYDLNHVRILFIQACLEQMSDQEFAQTKSPEKNAQPWKNCNDGVAQVRENTAAAYPLMRRDLLLSNLLSSSVIDQMMTIYEGNLTVQSNPADIDGLRVLNVAQSFITRDIVVHNPLTTVLTSEQLANPPWEIREIADALDNTSDDSFNKLFNQGFASWRQKIQQRKPTTWPMNLIPMYEPHIGDVTQMKLLPSGKIYLNYTGSPADVSSMRSEIEMARSVQIDALRSAQSRMQGQFITLVQSNPWIALVTSANPSRAEFIKAFALMEARASIAIAEHTKFRSDYHLDDRDLADDSAMVSLMSFTPIAKSLLDKPGLEMSRVAELMSAAFDPQKTFDGLMWDYNYQETKKAATQVAEAIALNTFVCWLPVSRGGRVGVQFVRRVVRAEKLSSVFTAAGVEGFLNDSFSPICFAFTNVAINLGFVYLNVGEYNQTYRDVFSSVEEESLMREVNSLSDKDREIFWSLVTIPVGTGIFKLLKGPASRLSKRLLDKAAAMAARQ